VRSVIPSLVSGPELKTLQSLCEGRELCCDVGTFTGSSAEAMILGGAGHIVTIDTFKSHSGGPIVEATDQEEQLTQLFHRLRPYSGKYSIIMGRSEVVGPLFGEGVFNLVFIDAAHDYESIKRDIAIWRKKVKSGGILCGHDFEKHASEVDEARMNERAHLDFCGEDQMHYGVIKAVSESFSKLRREWSVWIVDM